MARGVRRHVGNAEAQEGNGLGHMRVVRQRGNSQRASGSGASKGMDGARDGSVLRRADSTRSSCLSRNVLVAG